MIVKYVLRDGELVSRAWAIIIDELRRRGVPVQINEGHRTIERQTFFWNCFQCQCCNNGNLAARPTPFAPHIRIGFANHAIDWGDPERIMRELTAMGLSPSRPAGLGTPRWEPWHIEVPLVNLLRAARKFKGDKFDTLPKHVERAARRFIGARNTVRNRIEDRDRIDSKKHPVKWKAADALADKAVKRREVKRAQVEQLLKRSKKPKVRRILRELLDN